MVRALPQGPRGKRRLISGRFRTRRLVSGEGSFNEATRRWGVLQAVCPNSRPIEPIELLYAGNISGAWIRKLTRVRSSKAGTHATSGEARLPPVLQPSSVLRRDLMRWARASRCCPRSEPATRTTSRTRHCTVPGDCRRGHRATGGDDEQNGRAATNDRKRSRCWAS
jgi:hypothetical protein